MKWGNVRNNTTYILTITKTKRQKRHVSLQSHIEYDQASAPEFWQYN